MITKHSWKPDSMGRDSLRSETGPYVIITTKVDVRLLKIRTRMYETLVFRGNYEQLSWMCYGDGRKEGLINHLRTSDALAVRSLEDRWTSKESTRGS